MKLLSIPLLLILISNFDASSLIKLNNRPIIGILSQELTTKRLLQYPDKTSYIAASYIKYVEGAGGRAVPIFIGKNEEYYENILKNINGVLLPGGAVYFTNRNGYAEAGAIIYKKIIEMNKNGIYMPIWGTCLGFELLAYMSANNIEIRTACTSQAQSIPLNFTRTYNNSKLFGNIPKNIRYTLETKNATANFHKWCITESTMEKFKLNKIWKVLSKNIDQNGLEFISIIEHKKYPFYGVQFHPEKNIYEFVRNRNINHDPDVILASQYFANFFINESRKNFNSFSSELEEQNYLIYNYRPEYTAKNNSAFEQIYFFDEEIIDNSN
ncbi:gamma-glutamyl hydrolase A-like [Condylostylus longicornis]|uniref:gamma-glutamyl hydrolase A-like n=1 Tax=Condylostylus longicornis TaxID=2530218 RepID=UPI00244E1EBC|nr:gamma-glutamyl hydrolase A-like [Condylostylus longicornis]